MKYTEEERLEFARTHKWGGPHNVYGARVYISTTAKIGNDGFGWVRDEESKLIEMPHAGNIVLGSDITIRDYVTVDRAVVGSTTIGDGTKIDHHCHIAHGAKIGKHNTLANGCIIEGSCEVGDYNTFGAGVIVQTKVKIGSHCKFGSGSVVTKDVPDGETWVGNPARKLEDKKTTKLPQVRPL